MMTPKQYELLEHVIKSLRDPLKSPYNGMDTQKAFDILAFKLEEVKHIADYERAKGII